MSIHELTEGPRPYTGLAVCLSCGCGEPNDTRGDSRHIIYDQLKAAAEAAMITPQEAAENILDSLANVTD